MLRLDGLDAMAHDGWQILREVVGGGGGGGGGAAMAEADVTAAVGDIRLLLNAYLAVEHGGGADDAEVAASLLDERASLLAVGSSPMDEAPTGWSAPAGTLLEVARETYLQGVAGQSPHVPESALHDRIVAVDVLSCGTAAAATVHVGNGARTELYVDHLLLARDSADASSAWRIISKTFSPRPWPKAAGR